MDDYRRFVLALAERVASAHEEDTPEGTGGEPVSAAERSAIDEIAATLGTSAPEPGT